MASKNTTKPFTFDYSKYDTDQILSTDECKKLLHIVLNAGTGTWPSIVAGIKLIVAAAVIAIIHFRMERDKSIKKQEYEQKRVQGHRTAMSRDKFD